mmetsp:Transcript_495/g.801  ORF Transcript_495/g.801 Transcript_495/m.801 type:complete len:383 (-) Transcript_495:1951-3099(-)|eukprot:CAMPEP_0113621198 /NCGR_PEP_ID=MMETSP0017_2-20120614/10825_1 /TAXON_ID=2856 /ORGANISM="Cylindrotheca closterium" /LENGTH=382 /DNA_ID=CAMNT_0000530923 /DNA_START=53 /DNA_END=1201 /DNA_ORIENTATION=- /assembly_acc=CAM_ASM_000147
MVIYNNDSCNTLVSLDADPKSADYNDNYSSPEQTYVPTNIRLPVEECCYWDEEEEQQLYLPLNSRVDHYLKGVPQLMDSRDELLASPPVSFSKNSTEKVLYVAQGEVAHCTSAQSDVLVSDKATTCHIVAFRSEVDGNDSLSSMTHIDGTAYENCIQDMVDEHIAHHQESSEEEKKSELSTSSSLINLDVHVMGGFDDADSTSLEISVWFMGLLARIAQEQSHIMKITLKTCAITSLNDNGFECPIGRGLGIDTRSGDVFLATVEEEAAGPQVTLRSVRLFAESETKTLSLIHSSRSDTVKILPFSFNSFGHIDKLLKLPDKVLLQYTSTSPHVEEPDFCSCIRSSLKYLRDKKCKEVFGPNVDQTLVYRRSGKTNQWSIAR